MGIKENKESEFGGGGEFRMAGLVLTSLVIRSDSVVQAPTELEVSPL